MNKFRFLLAVSTATAALTGGFVAPVSAQQITSSVQGKVTTDQGDPISGATVVVIDTRTGAARSIVTGSDGSFNATGLVTGGPYNVTATSDGYEGQTVEGLTITLQGATSLTFNLVPSTSEEVIVVTASRANVTQLAVGPGTSFGSDVLESAPSFNRDVRDIIRIDPRVSLDRDDGGSGQDRISCLGGNDRGNAFTVDGISQGDIYGLNDTGFASRSSTPIPYAAVRETQVQFAPFDVDYGQFTGCAINVVTKSGTNSFTGGGFFEYSNSDLRGTKVADSTVAPIEPEKRWGVSLGGPIIPDRLFFYGAFESQEAGQSQDDGPAGAGFPNELAGVTEAQFNEISQVLRDVYGVDTGPLVRNRPFKNKRYFGRLDWQINDNHRLEGTYQHLEESTLRADDFFTSSSSPGVVGENTFYLSGTESDYYSARLYSQWTDNVSTELRYSRSKVQDLQDPFGGGEAQLGNPIPQIIVGVDNTGSIPDGTVKAGPGNSRSANDLRTKLEQYRAVMNVDFGAHRIKLGAEMNHADLYNLFVQNATGTLVFRNIDDLRAGLLSPGLGSNQTSTLPSNVTGGQTEGAFGNYSFSGDINDAAATFTRSIYSAFVQDDWDVTDRLNVVLGARLDWYDGGSPRVNPNYRARYGFSNTTGFSNLPPIFLPRFGFSYDAGDFSVFERTKLHGGVGIFSGGDPLVWFGNAFQNNGIGNATGTTQDAACASLAGPGGQIDVVTGGVFTGVPACFQQSAQASAAAAQGDTQSISPDIKMPTVVRANFGFNSQLNFTDGGFFSDWNLNVDYIYSEYQNPFTVVDLSQFPDPRQGLSGYAVDGRPVYRALDPTRTGCTGVQLIGLNPGPVYSGVTTSNAAACFGTSRDDEIMLTNTDPYRTHVASLILSKNFRGGVFTDGGSTFVSLGYAYTDAHDRRSMYNSTATSNYDYVAAFDRQNPEATRGFYSSAHNISLQTTFREKFFGDLQTTLSTTFVARSGRPYSLTFSGSGTFNDSASGSDNALVYLPSGPNDPNIAPIGTGTNNSSAAAVDGLVAFAQGLNCAKDYIGKTIARNTCTNDWYFDLDLSLSQELPGPGHFFGLEDKIRVYAMFDNFLNFLDRNWNVQRRRNFAGLQDIATTTGVDSQGRYIIKGFGGVDAFNDDNQINVSSSVWRVKFGISYDF